LALATIAQRLLRLLLSVPGDDEPVEAELHLAAGGAGVLAHIDDLFGDAGEVLAVGEVPSA
jgi:hypothetical protein